MFANETFFTQKIPKDTKNLDKIFSLRLNLLFDKKILIDKVLL